MCRGPRAERSSATQSALSRGSGEIHSLTRLPAPVCFSGGRITTCFDPPLDHYTHDDLISVQTERSP